MTETAHGVSSIATAQSQEREPMFSVVIPTFNRAGLLEQALNSVFAQRFTSYELIVVDDGSTDSTVHFLRSLELKLTFLTQPNRGPASARNLGASRARGAYLAFLDSDDVWFPWTLEVYARILRETANPSFLAGRPHPFGAEVPPDVPETNNLRWNSFTDYLASGDEWRWFGASSFVLARSRFLAIGGFTPQFRAAEDPDLCLRLGIAPGFVQVIAPATFGYREHTGHISSGARFAVEGALNLVNAELGGAYPGGKDRRWERWRILTRHVRPAAIAGIRNGMIRCGFTLYLNTFIWQLSIGAWRFVFGFPPLSVFYAIARRVSPKA